MNALAQQTEFLSWKIVPARLDALQASWFLGFEPQEIPMLVAAGFDITRPAVVASTGVSMYLTRGANLATLREIAALVPGSTLAMTFLQPPELVDPADRPLFEMVMARAAAAGTPFVSLFEPDEMLALAREAGLADVTHVSTKDIVARYFEGRPDGLRPSSGESFLIART